MEDLAVKRAYNPPLLAEIDYVFVDEVQPFVEGTVNADFLKILLRPKVSSSLHHF